MAVFGADDDPEPEAREVAGVLMAVAQGPAQEFAYCSVQAAGEPGGGLDEVPVVVIRAGEKMGCAGVGRERLVVLGVVALPGGACLVVEGRVEVVGRALVAGTGGDQPAFHVGPGIAAVDGASPPAGFHLEQDHVIDGADPLVRRVLGGELLRRLAQQWVIDLVQRDARGGNGQSQILAQAPYGRPYRHGG